MIIDYKLTYPSGTATAVLINGFHTPKGDVMAKYEHVLFFPVFFFVCVCVEMPNALERKFDVSSFILCICAKLIKISVTCFALAKISKDGCHL